MRLGFAKATLQLAGLDALVISTPPPITGAARPLNELCSPVPESEYWAECCADSTPCATEAVRRWLQACGWASREARLARLWEVEQTAYVSIGNSLACVIRRPCENSL